MEAKSPLEAALLYARMGYRVLPLVPQGKAPLVVRELGFVHGKDDATRDQTRLRTLWTRYPEANVGLVPGSRTLVLDLDSGELLRPLLALYPELAEAPRARTGGGRVHLFLRLPEGMESLPARSRALGLPLDLRGMDRAYLVAPPSRHPGGGVYRWEVGLREEEELPLLPRSLALSLKGPKPPRGGPGPFPFRSPKEGAGRERALGELEQRSRLMAFTPEGRRHTELVRHAVALWRYVQEGSLSPHEVEASLGGAALRSGLEEREVAGVLQWVARIHLRRGGR